MLQYTMVLPKGGAISGTAGCFNPLPPYNATHLFLPKLQLPASAAVLCMWYVEMSIQAK